ncbi:DinB family protein [Azovibrio restrictus]|uniref:DinB family protein n=1 Tax=Azovibrio restrictus TaxID=146938 RepID=UPI0026ED3448|nr:DinB family protein [Azovibrio restrictus]
MHEMRFLTLMADYNRWMNEKLYAVCAQMPDETRKRDLGAFFRSIHGTLNHLLLVDLLWLGRITGNPFPIQSLDQELHADFLTLKCERQKTDGILAARVAELHPARFTEPLTYTSLVKKESVMLPLGLILTHLFHHQTHHRGQITTLISQLGYDMGDTDMIFMPDAGTAYFPSRLAAEA